MSEKKPKQFPNPPWAGKLKPTVKEMPASVKRIRKPMKSPVPEHAELLYDEKGLPK